MKNSTRDISRFIAENRTRFEDMLAALVEIPTVSADPDRRSEMHRAAVLASKYLRSCGALAEVHKTSGNPVVVGRFASPTAKRTVTVYNHLDVQPADEPQWKSDPFSFQNRGGIYRGRGSTDDKGPALTALLAAQYAAQSEIPLNIQFVWELEEEIGSRHFPEFLKANRRSLKTDSVLVIDSIWISRDQPSICYALRGNITGTMTLETAETNVHSGVTGGVARNPLTELCRVVSKCYDAEKGRVLVPEFYQEVKKVTSEEGKNFLASGFHLKKWAASYGLKKLRIQNGMEAMERLWCYPTFEIHGINGGYSGPGVKTAIPPQAELKFSCRLVPDQKPDRIAEILRQHVATLNPDVRVEIHSMLYPYLGSYNGPYAKAAFEAMKAGFGRAPVFVRSGGSDGAIITMHKYLNAPIVMIGLSVPEHGYHAPNEYFDWTQASGGIKTFVRYFELISQL